MQNCSTIPKRNQENKAKRDGKTHNAVNDDNINNIKDITHDDITAITDKDDDIVTDDHYINVIIFCFASFIVRDSDVIFGFIFDLEFVSLSSSSS